MNIEITSCANGYIIFDRNYGVHYVATRLESYSVLDQTVMTVLQELERKRKLAQETLKAIDPSEEI